MVEQIGAIDAGAQTNEMTAIVLAIAAVMAPKDKQGAIRRETKRLLKLASPEVNTDGP